MRTTRSTARRAAVSAIAARRCAISERRHEAHLASGGASARRRAHRPARRRGPALQRGVERQPHARSGCAVRRAARAEIRRRGVRRRRRGARRGGRHCRSGGAAARCRRFSSRMRFARCSSSRERWRADHSIPIVAVGGSNGKTTTKEMTAAILSRMGPCLATHGNLNNHIGVPLTLMRLEPSHRSAVIEMGANRIGDVAELVTLARPTVGSHHQRRRGTPGGIRRSRRRRQGRG